MLRRTGLWVLAATLGISGSAWAQGAEPGWSLSWQAPADCPTQAAVQAEVRSLLEGSTRTDVKLAVSGDALAVNEGYEVELRFASAEGPAQRVLTGRDCKEVAKAAALVIALAVDPGVKIDPNRASKLETPTPPVQETKPPPPALPKKAESPKPKPATRAPTAAPLERSWGVAAGGVMEWGTLPLLALGAQLGVFVRLSHVRATLGGEFFPAHTYNADQGTRLRMSMLTGSLLLGYAIEFGEHSLRPEIGLRIGNLAASARDADTPASADSLLFGPQAGITGTLGTGGPLGFWLGLHSGLNLERPRLVVENRGVAHQPERVWVAVALGVSSRWP